MKLKSVEIENFRAIKKCSIHFKELSGSDPNVVNLAST